MRILVVDDEPSVREALERVLRLDGFEVALAEDGMQAVRHMSVAATDAVVLDVLMPRLDGLEVCRRLRDTGDRTPVLMLTARDAVDDRVFGLESGADDYLVKPFAFKELLARVQALARRPPQIAPERRTVADLEVDLRTREVRRAGRPLQLTAKEFELLEFLLRNEGSVVDRAAITAAVWDDNHDPFTNVLEVLVRRLRRKLDDEFEPKLIHTLRGAGYRFGV
jgi:DNA-binding response OmpR family regulator